MVIFWLHSDKLNLLLKFAPPVSFFKMWNHGSRKGLHFGVLFLKSFVYFFVVVGLHCCARAFSSCGGGGLLFAAVCWLLLLWLLLCKAQALGSGLRSCLLWAVERRLSGVALGLGCSAACKTFPDKGSNPCPLQWQVDCYPLYHHGSPLPLLLFTF